MGIVFIATPSFEKIAFRNSAKFIFAFRNSCTFPFKCRIYNSWVMELGKSIHPPLHLQRGERLD